MLDSNTDFCLTGRQDHAMSSPGTASLKVLPRMLPGTGSTDQDMFKYSVMRVNLGYILRLKLSYAGQKKDNNGSFGVKNFLKVL